MDQENYGRPQCSKIKSQTIEIQIENDNSRSLSSKVSMEINSQRLDNGVQPQSTKNTEEEFSITTTPLSIPKTLQTMNKPLQISSNLASITSIKHIQPLSLFIQALAKLNESSISLAIPNSSLSGNIQNANSKIYSSPEISPPNSLTSAPPSYSFVLRQMAARRRPRLMGTFIPSPSFVQHTPPPNYTTAFDIYVDSPLPPPPRRVYNFGFTPMPIVCPECGFTGMTMVSTRITLCTHVCAIVLCLLCCWVCAPLPYVLKSCKDVYHYCRNCRIFLGRYCPTNPEGTQAYA